MRDEQLKTLEPRILAIIERLGGVQWPERDA